ncbi:MAG TPA: hydrogenase expression/formation protein HypE, partial [Anaerolineales bacterium]|nr:hydrogenase expression/formation protein HypE [Anaerolineales bacterium]
MSSGRSNLELIRILASTPLAYSASAGGLTLWPLTNIRTSVKLMSEIVKPTIEGLSCPVPLPHQERITVGHGSGGKMMHDLITKAFMKPWDNPSLRAGNDGSVISTHGHARLVVSTDAHVVSPLFFLGGDIGSLAVCGTVNDVAMMGARPLYLTASFILEEGLEIETLARVVDSMCASAKEAGVQIVAGDTKVVGKGSADGMYISTTGVGLLPDRVNIGGAEAKPGDAIILSGTLGDHGIAVLSARGALGLETELESDIAPLNDLIAKMMSASSRIHVLRDPTRGGLATTLNEIARQSNVGIVLDEGTIPIKPAVDSACELLGFDPLYIANEGKLVAIVAEEDSAKVLEVMRAHKYG